MDLLISAVAIACNLLENSQRILPKLPVKVLFELNIKVFFVRVRQYDIFRP
jgi:hypothetical protein